jgi:DNA-binding NarL/FixJ family response regulator
MNLLPYPLNPIRVILADDHELLRDGLKSLFKKSKDVSLVAEAANGRELYEKVKEYKPDVVIVDVRMPVLDGVAVTALIRGSFPNIKILALSTYDEQQLIGEMLDAGANGYLLKNISKEDLMQAVKMVHIGKDFFCATASKKLLHYISKNRELEAQASEKKIVFTDRQLEILRLICSGKSNKEIGGILGLSSRPVLPDL